MTFEPLIDVHRIAAIGGIENPAVMEILARFVAELAGDSESLAAAAGQADPQELQAVLHRLKGAARTCGFDGLARAAADWMEQGGAEGSVAHRNLEQAIAASVREWDQLLASLECPAGMRA
jgi:HPt (histidine-containing phosphotransfer) domain-containing protein